jgi:hypothetical protein
MGTNYYRIPTVDEMESKKEKLIKHIEDLILTPFNIERGFRVIQVDEWSSESPWDSFIEDTNIHLGKRSSGWKFCWNFHNNKYYSNKEELLKFIRSGRVVDEYGQLQDTEEFIKMALEWDGIIADEEYFKKSEKPTWFNWRDHVDKVVDGLRVSSSVDFC